MCRISVIIPLLNMRAFIQDALDSISRQEVQVQEIIVIDDGSSDGSFEFLQKKKNIHLLKGQGKGPGAARNMGLERSTGDVITFLDADDLWPKEKLKVQLERLESDPRVEMVSGQIVYFESLDSNQLAPLPDNKTKKIYFYQLGAGVYRREVFNQIGYFDESLTYGEDLDFFFRMQEEEVPFCFLPIEALYYRQHVSSMTYHTTQKEKHDFHHAIHKSVLRRRRAGNMKKLPPLESYVEQLCLYQ